MSYQLNLARKPSSHAGVTTRWAMRGELKVWRVGSAASAGARMGRAGATVSMPRQAWSRSRVKACWAPLCLSAVLFGHMAPLYLPLAFPIPRKLLSLDASRLEPHREGCFGLRFKQSCPPGHRQSSLEASVYEK